MSVIYSEAWYDDLKQMINESPAFAKKAPTERLALTLEIIGDERSPYVPSEDESLYYRLVLDGGKVEELRKLDERHGSDGLDFRFTAPATVWEEIAAGQADPITAGLRGTIRVRGDMRFLMRNAEAVKALVDMYGDRVDTEWPKGKPPY